MVKREEVEDAVRIFQALSINDLYSGAKILMLHTNLTFDNKPFDNLYENYRKKMPNKSEQVEVIINSLQKIRNACVEKLESIKFVEMQAEQMVNVVAIRDFLQKYIPLD